jgi:hypothetical protein
MKTLLNIVFVCTLFAWLSCHNNPTGPSQAAISLSAVYVGVTDAALRLHISYTLSTDRFQLRADTAVIAGGLVPLSDTVIYVDNLLPYRSYYFYLAKLDSAGIIEGGSTLTFTTMDTTSNNFTWQFDTLAGQGGSSYLNDVVIINDTLAYAVGALYHNDSTGHPDPIQDNLAVWDGKKWTLQSVGDYYGTVFLPADLFAIFVFSKNDIWVGGSGALHWDGASWHDTYITNQVFNGRVQSLWGNSSSDLYIVGTNGSMAHYDGSAWTPVQSGTSLDIQDIWGATDSTTGQQTILAAAGNTYVSNARQVLQITGMQVTTLSDNGINGALRGIWFLPGKQYWVVGDGVWEDRQPLTMPQWNPYFVTTYFSEAIRGDALNNIFVCGDDGNVWHYNGFAWHSSPPQVSISGLYYSVAVKGNLVIAVGELNPPAIVAIGRR